jgi:plasmid stabilization system protein ParE
VAPGAITRAYRGEGVAALHRLLETHGPRPIEHYLEFWNRSVWSLAALWVVIGLGWSTITRPAFQRWWDARTGAAPALSPSIHMGRRRFARVHALILFLLAGQTAAIVSWLEAWPFSPYKMFSETRRPGGNTLTKYRVVGIPADERSGEVRLTPRMLEPLFNSSVQTLIRRARQARHSEEAIRDVAVALLDFYETGRRRGTHDGPQLVGLRLYEDFWTHLHPRAEDADRPHRRTLLVTVGKSG